jgi:hypothetical protein
MEAERAKRVAGRVEAWKGLFRSHGWLQEGRIKIPADTKVHIYFSPATTDINSIQSISLAHHTEYNESFIIYRPSATEEEYYLWDDIQCVKIKSKKSPKAS